MRGSSLALASALLVAGCGQRPFDPPSAIQTLRVVALRMDHPTPQPGTDVTIEMLPYDGSPNARGADGKPRPFEIVWLGGCADPSGDLYYKCYDTMGPALDAFSSGASSPLVGHGTTYTLHVPADLISRRGSSAKFRNQYGLQYVFFALCAGKVVATGAADTTSPRLGCVDANGAPVGADGFVYGYLPIYSYPTIDNHDPIVTGGTFNGVTPSADACTTDGDCKAGKACGSSGTCLPIVSYCPPRSASGSCATYAIAPIVDPSSAEPDPLASMLSGSPRNEVIYVEYLASAGRVAAGSTNIVIDPVNGPQTGWEGTWTPPDHATGETRIWALVHDDRGGLSWWWQDVVVR
jgi:hypothetical protein